MTTLHPVSIPALAQSRGLAGALALIQPVGWHLLWMLAVFGLLIVAVFVRLDVQQFEINLDRNDRAQRAASVLNERLELELRARRRLQVVQGYATQLHAVPEAPVVRVEGVR